MSEHLSITIPRGYGSVQSLSDGSLRVSFPMDAISDYREVSEQFIGIGVGLMFRGRELHGDLQAAPKQDGEDAQATEGKVI